MNIRDVFGISKRSNALSKVIPLFSRNVKEEEEGKASIATKERWISGKYDDEEQNQLKITKYYGAYYNFPIVAAAIDSKVEQVVQDYRFDGPDASSLMKWAQAINLGHHLRILYKDGLVGGTVWAEMVPLESSDAKGIGRLQNAVTFKHIDSKTMRIYRTPKGKTLCHMQEANSRSIYWGALPEGKQGVKGGELDDMFCWKWNVLGANKYGTSMINSAIPMLEIKERMEDDMKAVVQRYVAPIIHAKIGDELHPADQTEVDSMQSQLEDIYADTEYVTNHLVEMNVLDFKNKGLDPSPYFLHIDSQVLIGLQTHSIMLATEIGQGIADAKSAEIRLRANGRHIRAIQDELRMAIEEQVLAKMTGTKKNKLIWESVEERQFEVDVTNLTTLVSSGVITAQKANDLLPDQYREELPDLSIPPLGSAPDKPLDNPTDPTKSTNTNTGVRQNKSEHLNIPNAKAKPQKIGNMRLL